MEKEEADIAILGAGLTGLAIADSLIGSGKKIVLLEKDCSIGGLAKTLEYKGFRFDLGGHRLYFHRDASLRYVRSLVGEDKLLCHTRKSRIFLNGRFLRYPPRFSDIFSYRPSNIFKFIFENFPYFFQGKRKNSGSLKDWVYSRFGPTIHNLYFNDYSHKVWGLTTEEISADWAERRIGDFDSFQLLKEVFARINSTKENASLFYYPSEGIGSLCDNLALRIKDRAGLILNAEISKLECLNGEFRSLIYRNNGDYSALAFKHLISTIPLVSLCRSIYSLDSEREALSKKISYRSLILVFLIVNKERVFQDHWIYFPEKDVAFSRISEPKNWSHFMVRDGKTSLCCEIFCNYHDDTWNLADGQIINRVTTSLEKLRLAAKDDISDCLVVRVPFAYPLLYTGYKNDLEFIFKKLSGFKNLVLAGRNGMHAYLDIEECLEEAMKNSSLTIKEV